MVVPLTVDVGEEVTVVVTTERRVTVTVTGKEPRFVLFAAGVMTGATEVPIAVAGIGAVELRVVVALEVTVAGGVTVGADGTGTIATGPLISWRFLFRYPELPAEVGIAAKIIGCAVTLVGLSVICVVIPALTV
jgi:hypothetical protein